MSDDTKKVAASFGQEIDLSDLEGFDIKELLDINTDLLKVEGGDPNYEYGWIDVRDPMHHYKLRKGTWEQVDADEGVICAGSVKDGNQIRVNELMLVKCPKDKFRKLRAAIDAISLSKEAKIAQRFKQEVGGAGKPWGADTAPAITSDDKVGVQVKYKGKER